MTVAINKSLVAQKNLDGWNEIPADIRGQFKANEFRSWSSWYRKKIDRCVSCGEHNVSLSTMKYMDWDVTKFVCWECQKKGRINDIKDELR